MNPPKNYGLIPKGVSLYPAQQRAVDACIDAFTRGESSFLLISATGTGKTPMAHAMALWWREMHKDDPLFAMAKSAILYVAPSQVIRQVRSDCRYFFGVSNYSIVRHIGYAGLRTSDGTDWIERIPCDDPIRRADITEHRPLLRWKALGCPGVIIFDEMQGLNNVGTLQHELGLMVSELLQLNPLLEALGSKIRVKIIFMSATPATVPAHLEPVCAAYVMGEGRGIWKNNDFQSLFTSLSTTNRRDLRLESRRRLVQSIVGGLDPYKPTPTGMQRVSHFLDAVTHRVPHLRFKYRNNVSVRAEKPTQEELTEIQRALEDYVKQCEKLGKGCGLSSQDKGQLVALTLLRKRCELQHARHLAEKAAAGLANGFQVSIACEFKTTLVKTIVHLVDEHKVSVEKLALIFGPTEQFDLNEKTYERSEIVDVFTRLAQGEEVDRDIIDAMTNQILAEQSGMFDAIRRLRELGLRLGGFDPQDNIARFQRGEARIGLWTFGYGSVGLNLNHSWKQFKLQPDEYEVFDDSKDESKWFVYSKKLGRNLRPDELPAPRLGLIAPTWKTRNFVQAIGRPHRLDSLSETRQSCFCFEGTIEMLVLRTLGKHMHSMATLVRLGDVWTDLLKEKEFGGLVTEVATIKDEGVSVDKDEVEEDSEEGED